MHLATFELWNSHWLMGKHRANPLRILHMIGTSNLRWQALGHITWYLFFKACNPHPNTYHLCTSFEFSQSCCWNQRHTVPWHTSRYTSRYTCYKRQERTDFNLWRLKSQRFLLCGDCAAARRRWLVTSRVLLRLPHSHLVGQWMKFPIGANDSKSRKSMHYNYIM